MDPGTGRRGKVGYQKVSNALRLVFCNSANPSSVFPRLTQCQYHIARIVNLVRERGVGLKNEGSTK